MYLFPRASYFFKALALCLLLLLGAGKEGYGQTKVLANQVTYSSPNVPGGLLEIFPPYSQKTVENPTNATTDNNLYARLNASPGLVAGLGAFGGMLELKFPGAKVPGGTTSYIKINASDNLLAALLGGTLGKALNGVVSTVALGAHVFNVEARDGNTVVYTTTSSNQFTGTNAKIVTDKDGYYYLAITPSSNYDRIRISNQTTSLLGLNILQNPKTLDVYNAFYLQGSSVCDEPLFTSFDATGISLDLLDLGGSGVTNPEHAIDGDTSTFSEISIGTLGVGAAVFQNIYFNTLSSPQDNFTIRLAIKNAGVLTTDLLGSMQVIAYNGNTHVYTTTLQSGVINGLDLLTLLKSNRPITLSFNPIAAFDRISIGYNSLISLSALSDSPIRLYEVTRTPPPPSIEDVDENQNLYVCEGDGPLEIKIENSNSGYEYHWYTDSELGTAIDMGNSHILSGPFAYGETYTFYVSASKSGCSDESARTMVIVNVLPQAGKPHLTITDIIN